MSHAWWHKDDGMTSKEAVARTQASAREERANVREQARQPSLSSKTTVPIGSPSPHRGAWDP